MVHMPTGIVQHSGNHAVAIATVSPRERNDVIGQPFFITDSTTSQAKGWATTDFAEGETASPIAYPYGHELVVTRLANSNWINFEVHVTK